MSTEVKRSLSYCPTLDGISKGFLAALVPGLHPMIFGKMEPFVLGVTYGVFTGLSILLAEKCVFHHFNAGQGSVSYLNILKGILLGLAVVPLLLLAYSVTLPDRVLLALLLLGSVSLAVQDPFTFFLSGLLGIVTLKLPVAVVAPLSSGLFYLFGSLFLFGSVKEGDGDWRKGVLASALTGYFPALPPSAWSKVLGNSDTAVAAVLSPLFSLTALVFGKTRSAMAAYIDGTDVYILVLVGLSYLLALSLVLSLARLTNIRRFELPRESGLAVMLGHSLITGPGNLLLLLSSFSLVRLTRSRPSAYFGFIVVPTLLYYA